MRLSRLAVTLVTALIAVTGCNGGAQDSDSITIADVEQAYEAAARCMQEQGWAADVHPDPWGGFQVTVAGAPGTSEADIERGAHIFDECLNVHVGDLDSQYRLQHVPTGEERERAFDSFVECLDTHGTAPESIWLGQPQGDLISEIMDVNGSPELWPPDFSNCIQLHYDALWPETIPQ